jgi:putative ABC transport system ATP-binding protein
LGPAGQTSQNDLRRSHVRPLGVTTASWTPPAAPAAVAADDVVKVYGTGPTAVRALAGVSAAFAAGQLTAIMGPSGSGKSTFMHCLAGLDDVTSGRITIGQTDITRLGDKQLTRIRRDQVGFVFQAFNLVPTLTARENILLPLRLAGRSPDTAWFDRIVRVLGLADRLSHRPSQLSGGQQQRVACARALVTRPRVIFADEPTGNLDSRSGAEVLSFLRSSVRELGQTVVMVTHDPIAASYAHRVLFLADGQLVNEMYEPTPDGVLERMKRFDAANARSWSQ